jgi:hypothetical protein
MATIVDRLLAEGIIPILSTIPPRDDSASADRMVPRYNAVVRAIAQTRGVPLVDLLDKEFTIGTVRLRGLRLFEPCAHLVKVSKIPGIFRSLEHRSGLKCAILSDGLIRVGDRVTISRSEELADAQVAT